MSGISGSEMKRRQRRLLYALQNGKCFWCDGHMRLVGSQNGNLATIDHLDERDSPNRGRFTNVRQRRRVLACYRCNHDRSYRPLKERMQMAEQAVWRLEREFA